MPLRRRWISSAAVLACVAATLVGCTSTPEQRQQAAEATASHCEDVSLPQGVLPSSLTGETLTVATTLSEQELAQFDASLDKLRRCAGMDVILTRSTSLEQDLRALAQSAAAASETAPPATGTPATDSATANSAGAESSTDSATSRSASEALPDTPDVAIVPQPALVAELGRAGVITPLSRTVNGNVELGWDRLWAARGTVDGIPYGAPLMASVKSQIWYSPATFAAAGYTVPHTWKEMVTLTARIAADHPQGDVTPWCLGLADGDSSGWPLSDWLEDVMLGTAGPAGYDAWAAHDVPLNSPAATEALGMISRLLFAPGHVAGGRDGAAERSHTQAIEDLAQGSCLMLHASSTMGSVLPEGTGIGDGPGELSTFVTPTGAGEEQPRLVGGDYLVTFRSSPAIDALATYLTSEQWATDRLAVDGVATGNHRVDVSVAANPVAEEATRILQSRSIVLRFDASDIMPTPVGTRSLWDALMAWESGRLDASTALDEAQQAWVTPQKSSPERP